VLACWRAVPAYIETEMANHREGVRRGYTAPRRNVEIAIRELDTLLVTPLERSPLYDPARRDSTPEFRAELARVIETEIVPEIRHYRELLASVYVGRAMTKIVRAETPHGVDCARGLI